MDMKHLGYLQQVADDDVKHLHLKEKTYKGSWKRRGGQGAFFMLARKWDRIEGMMEERDYDIFKDPGDGSDGTPLAEIRDLRRYLLLCEAELLARVEGFTVEAPARRMMYSPEEPAYPGTPADGGHHARPGNEMDRLEDGLPPQEVSPELRKYYREVSSRSGTRLVVDRPKVFVEMREHLPRLRTELNDKEYQEQLAEYQHLYKFQVSGNKWVMQPQYREHWGREA